jgi:hypothetical protein
MHHSFLFGYSDALNNQSLTTRLLARSVIITIIFDAVHTLPPPILSPPVEILLDDCRFDFVRPDITTTLPLISFDVRFDPTSILIHPSFIPGFRRPRRRHHIQRNRPNKTLAAFPHYRT